jgi:hypothetical protein
MQWHFKSSGCCGDLCFFPLLKSKASSPPKERVEEVKAEDLGPRVRAHVEARGEHAETALNRLYESLGRRREIRTEEATGETVLGAAQDSELASSPRRLAAERARRLEFFRSIAIEEGDALFAATGTEAWAAGAQLIAVTLT